MNTININSKFELINDLWTPRVLTELNGQQVKISKVKGEFVWHDHKNEDELFIILKGSLKMMFRDRTEIVKEGEMIMVPKDVKHKPVAEDEVWMMLIEPKNIEHTGDVKSHLTIDNYENI
ncbi:cupin domain-containing protein [Arenibacter sp. TNZ]|uniref:cupin domain-containing protein n=1 Tax=Arenibacter TaxID=178469 RepID=UPI000CD409DF|nr:MULTISPECIES: cupin domain-containing protein [Arenibacter]MCM4170547.1 cupin domain-containing protein [Arenibacter sp. TNZ]